MKQIKNILVVIAAVVLLYACSPSGGNSTGHEYMPDMAHSIAYESNVYTYYYLNTWDSTSVRKLKDLSNPRLPVKGTIPRGYAGYLASDAANFGEVHNMLRGGTNMNSIAVTPNGHVPYHYDNNEDERTRASNEIINNPFPITKAGLDKGKELYDINCGICHGEKGNGLGYLVADENPNAKYPAAPANFQQDTFYNSSNGRYYHSIMYGKNVMGSYADKLNYEERWQVIHYIRKLQADEKKLEYSAEANTYNPAYGTPISQVKAVATAQQTDSTPPPSAAPAQEEHQEENHDGGDGHSGGSHK